jgi:6-phosphogluconate dehydrogenase
MSQAVADIGLIGLAVMGQNLILNMNDHGYTVCAYNRTVSKVDHFLENEAKGMFEIIYLSSELRQQISNISLKAFRRQIVYYNR